MRTTRLVLAFAGWVIGTSLLHSPAAQAGLAVSIESISPTPSAVGELVTITGDATGGDEPYLRFDFSFGDGNGASGSMPRVQHSYTAPGTYTVALSVTDAAFNRSSATRVHRVFIPGVPLADAGGPYELPWGTDLVLDASASFDVSDGSLIIRVGPERGHSLRRRRRSK
jgi:hypothetical protein